jgi:hypothetical protein
MWWCYGTLQEEPWRIVPSSELLIWVVLSITIMALVTVSVQIPIKTPSTRPSLASIRKDAILRRSIATRNNASLLPKDQFLCRKHLFVDESQGLLVQQDKEDSDVTPMKSLSSLVKPHFIRSKVLENIANIGPQMVVGAWIRSMFHGYIVCRLPFWVPETFRSMLQSGMEMIGQHLDTRYVSGLSWYIVSIFGLQGLVLDKKEASMDRGSEWQLGSSSEIQTKMLLKQEIQWWKTIEYHCET